MRTIAVAVERNGWCYAYDKSNCQILSQPGKLWGFTSTTMSVKRGDFVYTYDVTGRQISSQFCK